MTDHQAFDGAFAGWLDAFCRQREIVMDDSTRLVFRRAFDERIPEAVRELIGYGLRTGVLRTDRGFYVHPASDDRRLASQWVFMGKKAPSPCWELFVQVAEVVRLAPIENELGLDLRIEDRPALEGRRTHPHSRLGRPGPAGATDPDVPRVCLTVIQVLR